MIEIGGISRSIPNRFFLFFLKSGLRSQSLGLNGSTSSEFRRQGVSQARGRGSIDSRTIRMRGVLPVAFELCYSLIYLLANRKQQRGEARTELVGECQTTPYIANSVTIGITSFLVLSRFNMHPLSIFRGLNYHARRECKVFVLGLLLGLPTGDPHRRRLLLRTDGSSVCRQHRLLLTFLSPHFRYG